MTTITATATRVAVVRSIGAAEVKCARVAAEIVEATADGYDWTARGAIAEVVHLWATGTDDKSERPAQREKKTINGEEVNEVTNYGRGVNSLVAAIKRLVTDKDDDTPKPRVLRVSLSGDGGGSTVVAEDHPLYAALVAMVTGEDAGEDAGDE